jgi:aminopeptidase
MESPQHYVDGLAQLAVGLGANVQPGQVVRVGSEVGKEQLARAVALAAYEAGAKFVDLNIFDPYVKLTRMRHADPETLGYVPPWYGATVLAVGDAHAANIALYGPVDPHMMDGIDPELLGRDMLPRVAESGIIVGKQLINWTVVPAPTPGWASLVYPDLPEADAFTRLWDQVAHICRLNEPDPLAAWATRLDQLEQKASEMNALALDALHFEGPGTDLTIGLLPSSRWIGARMKNVDGISHAANIPTEEVFTAPDPDRVDGVVTATKPLWASETVIDGLQVRFEGGRAVSIEASQNGETLRTLARRDAGGCRLGEVALVDRESRIGQTGEVFYMTLLDENAASHIALGRAYLFSVGAEDQARINNSDIHVDFMIGSNDVSVTGLTRSGDRIPVLRAGAWQI